MSASTDLLQMTGGWGQRSSTFRFELLNANLELTGSLVVDANSPPSIDNDVDSAMKRKLSNLRIPTSDANHINPLEDRIRVSMSIAGLMAAGARDYELGVFVPSDPAERPHTRQLWTAINGLDQLTMLDQDTETTWAVAPGTSISYALELRLAIHQVPVFEVEQTTSKVRGNEWLVWPAGTNGSDIIQDLCDLGGFYSPYFRNDGTCVIRRVPDLTSVDPTLNYGLGMGIYAESLEVVKDTWKLPNRFIVTSNAGNDEVVSGYWDVPASAPHSRQKRGRIISVTYDMQGLETNEDAYEAAKAKGQTHDRVFETVECDTPINPTHDTFDVVGYDGTKFHESGWNITCRDGERMQHQWRRIYQDEELAA